MRIRGILPLAAILVLIYPNQAASQLDKLEPSVEIGALVDPKPPYTEQARRARISGNVLA